MLNLLKNDLKKIASNNTNYIELYFERLLPFFTLNKDLWHMYLSYIDKVCKTVEKKYSFY